MLKEVIKTIKDDDTIWVMENRENSDLIFKNYISNMLFSSTYAIISSKQAYIFVHKLDEGNIKLLDNSCSKVYIYETTTELVNYILEVLKKLEFPQKLLISYTTMSDENTDIISYSSYLRITKLFRKLYRQNNMRFRVHSSEANIYELLSYNSKEDIKKMKILSEITDTILNLSFKTIKKGQSEIEIQENTKLITKEYLEKNKAKYGICSFDFAWENCPIVLVGENLQKGGHAIPSNKKIEQGDTIYYDFGIKGIFEDGTILYTDIQRMGYLLKEGEKNAPEQIRKIFDTLYSSISLGIDKMKSGVRGYQIDKIVRDKILSEGYPNYPHATGHPVGKEVHGAGALISYSSSKRARLQLVENGIYTLEPRINIKNGGSIEEMILVTKNGAIPLCNRQEELYLI